MSSVVLGLDTRGKTDMEKMIYRKTQRDRAQEAKSKPASQCGCWPHAENRVEVVSERDAG